MKSGVEALRMRRRGETIENNGDGGRVEAIKLKRRGEGG